MDSIVGAMFCRYIDEAMSVAPARRYCVIVLIVIPLFRYCVNALIW